MVQANFDYKEIAGTIVNRFEEREKKLMKRPDVRFARGWAWASDLNKCVLILEDLEKLSDLNKYQQWLSKEIKYIVPNVKYLDKFHKWILKGREFIDVHGELDLDKLNKRSQKTRDSIEVEPAENMLSGVSFDDKYGLRICLLSATVAYCAQFSLEDFGVFYNIYKEVLRVNGLECLIPIDE